MIYIFRFLFCFNNNIDELIKLLYDYSKKINSNFEIDIVNSEEQFVNLNDLTQYHSIVLQEYFIDNNPISIDYLEKLKDISSSNIICIFDDDRRNEYSDKLYKTGLYSCYFGSDLSNLSLNKFVDILIHGRNKIEAVEYYQIKEQLTYDDYMQIEKNIIDCVKRCKSDDEMLLYELEKYIKDMTDTDINVILTDLPFSITSKLLIVPKFYCQYSKIKSNLFPTYTNKNNNLIKKDTTETKIIPITCKNIGVIGMTKCCGTTFIAMNFACSLSEKVKVSVVEYPMLEPYMYTYIGLNAVCMANNDDFTSFPHQIEREENITGKSYVHHSNSKVSWLIQDATKPRITNWDSNKMMRLLYMPKEATLNIVDIGDKLFDDSIISIIEQFSAILVVVDPMVPNLINNIEYIEKIKELEKNTQCNFMYIINKYNKGVNKRELLNFLNVNPVCFVPYIDANDIYKAVYDGNIPYNYHSVKSQLSKPFEKLAKEIININAIH